MEKGAEMRLADIPLVNIPASPEGSTLRGTRRLLRDLVAVGLMQEERRPASERLQSMLGRDFASVVFAALTGTPGPGHASHGLRPRRAA
jgi:hypothetical protein